MFKNRLKLYLAHHLQEKIKNLIKMYPENKLIKKQFPKLLHRGKKMKQVEV
jgi:hypothetical protein